MKKTILLVLICHLTFAQTKLTQITYDGFISKIPINLVLTFDANLVYGTLSYKRVGQPIKVVGSLEKENFTLHEFGDKAEITGMYFGTKKGDDISGRWSNPAGKEMSFSMKKNNIISIDKPEIKSVTGSYAYNFGKDGGSGNMYVQQVGKDKIILEIQAVRGAPSYNQAIIEKTSLKLFKNEAIYENKEYGKCLLKISFFDGGASIIYLDEAYECGFGNAATVAGNYAKFDSRAPKFEQN